MERLADDWLLARRFRELRGRTVTLGGGGATRGLAGPPTDPGTSPEEGGARSGGGLPGCEDDASEEPVPEEGFTSTSANRKHGVNGAMDAIFTSHNVVEPAVASFNTNKGAGPDGLHPRILNALAPFISAP